MAISRKSKTRCIDSKGGEWKRHIFGLNERCDRCYVFRPDWDRTAARRRAGERLVGMGGAVVELTNQDAK